MHTIKQAAVHGSQDNCAVLSPTDACYCTYIQCRTDDEPALGGAERINIRGPSREVDTSRCRGAKPSSRHANGVWRLTQVLSMGALMPRGELLLPKQRKT